MFDYRNRAKTKNEARQAEKRAGHYDLFVNKIFGGGLVVKKVLAITTTRRSVPHVRQNNESLP
jgi:hypothetical protein